MRVQIRRNMFETNSSSMHSLVITKDNDYYTNEELRKFMYSKENFVGFGASLTKEPGADVIQACYALTKVLSDTKLTDTSKVKYA